MSSSCTAGSLQQGAGGGVLAAPQTASSSPPAQHAGASAKGLTQRKSGGPAGGWQTGGRAGVCGVLCAHVLACDVLAGLLGGWGTGWLEHSCQMSWFEAPSVPQNVRVIDHSAPVAVGHGGTFCRLPCSIRQSPNPITRAILSHCSLSGLN